MLTDPGLACARSGGRPPCVDVLCFAAADNPSRSGDDALSPHRPSSGHHGVRTYPSPHHVRSVHHRLTLSALRKPQDIPNRRRCGQPWPSPTSWIDNSARWLSNELGCCRSESMISLRSALRARGSALQTRLGRPSRRTCCRRESGTERRRPGTSSASTPTSWSSCAPVFPLLSPRGVAPRLGRWADEGGRRPRSAPGPG